MGGFDVNKSRDPYVQRQHGNSETILYNPDFIAALVGPVGTDIQDDVLGAAITLMQAHDKNNSFAIGEFTPAAQLAALHENKPHYITEEKTSINFIHVPGHWMTVIREFDTRKVLLLDSLRNSQRPQQVLPILKLMYKNITSRSIV